MPVPPKAKHPPTQAPSRRVDQTSAPSRRVDQTSAPLRRVDRTSAVVTTMLIVLTVLGVVTIFWEPLTALALGTPATDTVTEPRAPTATDGGATTSTTTTSATSNGSSASVDASGSS